MISGKQHTIIFHIDDLKSSHEDKTVNDKFEKWLQDKYGEHGEVKAHRGDVHHGNGTRLQQEEKNRCRHD